jgi:hypothetical protein
MVRPDRIPLTAGGLLARAALGFIGLAILIGLSTPPPEPAATASSQPDDPTRTAMTVTLRVPEGALAKHLSVVDASGRELAFLTHWISGMTTVVPCRSGGAGVSYHLNADGSANLRVDGTARATLIRAEPDGTTEVSPRDVRPGVSPRTTIDTQTPMGSDE